MIKRKKSSNLSLKSFLVSFFSLCLMLVVSSGCSKNTQLRQPQTTLDSPSHHTLRGKDMIRAGEWGEARREFNLALELQPKHSSALAGLALVEAHESSKEGKSGEQRKQHREEAASLLAQAFDEAQSPAEETAAHTYAIQVYSLLQTEDWLSKAEDHFEKAMDLVTAQPSLHSLLAEPHLYIARAYKQALETAKSAKHYREILDLQLGFTREANEELELLDKIIRAQPGTRHGNKIALKASITRADMAALLIEELNLTALYQRNTDSGQNNAFESPYKPFVPPSEQPKDAPLATDISKHPLRSDIEEVLKLGVRGLTASPQLLFYPDQEITRAEYAIMIEDILIRVTQDRSLATRYIGDQSPWRDVREDVFYYNAARTAVSRDIMGVLDKIKGEFGPERFVHGADALLGLRTVKDSLQSYVRSPES
ncbi:hypothetical protein WDW89_25270 [Deltaproteobacteria bacterium TL4]